MSTQTIPAKARYHKTDGWRGYKIPRLAIIGASDTGTWDDSPCPSNKVAAELRRFRREALRHAGIKSSTRYTASSNCFMQKRWLAVKEEDFQRAAQLAVEWLNENRRTTDYVHSADLEELGYGDCP